jgi:hypothetical protein
VGGANNYRSGGRDYPFGLRIASLGDPTLN